MNGLYSKDIFWNLSFILIFYFFLNCDASQDQLEKEIQKWGQKMNMIRCWVAAQTCVLSHFRTCDVRAERVLNCACGSACEWAIFWLAICDRTFLSVRWLILLKSSFFNPFFEYLHLPTYFSFNYLDLPALRAPIYGRRALAIDPVILRK